MLHFLARQAQSAIPAPAKRCQLASRERETHVPTQRRTDYARLPGDGNPYEVIDGEVYVTPAPGPRHQKIAGRLFLAMQPYVQDLFAGV